MLVSFLSHLLALDIVWLVALVMNNLFLLFAFMAIMHFFMEGKRVLLGFGALIFAVWTFDDFATLGGALLFTSGFLLFFYLTKLAVIGAAENSVAMKKKLIIFNEVSAIGLWIMYNIFMM